MEKALLEYRDYLIPYLGDIKIEFPGDFISSDIRPTQIVPILVKDPVISLVGARWGFRPEWAQKPIFNTRLEKFGTGFWKQYSKNTCLLPSTSFFEWSSRGGKKQKFRISPSDSPFFSLAGIFGEEGGSRVVSILTMPPKSSVFLEIHDRQPVRVKDIEISSWLNAPSSTLANPFESDELKIDEAE